jgi:hypothetical protein
VVAESVSPALTGARQDGHLSWRDVERIYKNELLDVITTTTARPRLGGAKMVHFLLLKTRTIFGSGACCVIRPWQEMSTV